MKSILDRSFHYTASSSTDLRKTFARVRREQRIQHQAQARADEEIKTKVLPIKRRRTAAELNRVVSEKP